MALLPRRGSGRRRHPALTTVALALLAIVGGAYAIGLTGDIVEVSERGDAHVSSATLASCGTTVPLRRLLLGRRTWRAPADLCGKPVAIRMTMADGGITSCTGFGLKAGQDYAVAVTGTGCGGFSPTILPALP